jgi:hypothetical protein
MNKKIVYSLIFLGLFAVTGYAFAQTQLENPLSVDTFEGLFARITTVVGQILMAVGALMITISGLLFMTSAGKPEKINTAKAALVYAILGIVIGGLATGIANLIISTLKS